MTKPGDGEAQEDKKQQERLLPFMMISLVVMSLLFFIATIWQFQDLQSRLKSPPPDIERVLQQLAKDEKVRSDSEYRDWYVRSVLEHSALTYRYRQNAAMIHARVWTRYMGFLTGMVLALSGCVFILGRLREKIDASLQNEGMKATLKTSSPGIFLAAVGSLLIALSIYVKVTVETHDQPVYFPQYVKVLPSDDKPPKPADLTPHASSALPQTNAPPLLPDSVIKKMKEQSPTENQ